MSDYDYTSIMTRVTTSGLYGTWLYASARRPADIIRRHPALAAPLPHRVTRLAGRTATTPRPR